MKAGKITPNGVSLEKHEYDTILFLTEQGNNVKLIAKSNKQGEHTPDIRIGRLFWEIKAPKGEGKALMKNTLQKAARQSENVIIDLRRTKRHQARCLNEIKREFVNSKSLKRAKIITKDQKGRPPKQVVQLRGCLGAIVAYHREIRTSISIAL